MTEQGENLQNESTQTRPSLDDLIAKMEGAPEGSHELDADLVMRLGLPCETAADEEGAMYQRIGSHQQYTRSIDAARSWTPEGWLLTLHESVHGYEATLQNRHASDKRVRTRRPVATAPLAICIANALTFSTDPTT